MGGLGGGGGGGRSEAGGWVSTVLGYKKGLPGVVQALVFLALAGRVAVRNDSADELRGSWFIAQRCPRTVIVLRLLAL